MPVIIVRLGAIDHTQPYAMKAGRAVCKLSGMKITTKRIGIAMYTRASIIIRANNKNLSN